MPFSLIALPAIEQLEELILQFELDGDSLPRVLVLYVSLCSNDKTGMVLAYFLSRTLIRNSRSSFIKGIYI